MATVTHIARISEDVFELIFDFLDNDTPYPMPHQVERDVTSISSSSLVCRKWNEVLKPRLFSKLDVILSKDRPASEFLAFLRAKSDISSYIRDLRLYSHPWSIAGGIYIPPWQDLVDILDVLPRLNCLLIKALWLDNPARAQPFKCRHELQSMELCGGNPALAYGQVASMFTSIGVLHIFDSMDPMPWSDSINTIPDLLKHSVAIRELHVSGIRLANIETLRSLLVPSRLEIASMRMPHRNEDITSVVNFLHSMSGISSYTLVMFIRELEESDHIVDISPNQFTQANCPHLREVIITLNLAWFEDDQKTFDEPSRIQCGQSLPVLLSQIPPSVTTVTLISEWDIDVDNLDPRATRTTSDGDGNSAGSIDWRGVDDVLAAGLPLLTCVELRMTLWSRSSFVPESLSKEQEDWYCGVLPKLAKRGVILFSRDPYTLSHSE
ncbi:hypothetical protein K474DRAFT_1712723 [Panus rudis PR-1116 ss-1]|nr:hypothetical protein K474DRAFT_1712723 [Panus rudis PR-1116 ss-1]